VGLENFHETVAAGVADFLAGGAVAPQARGGDVTLPPERPS